MQIITSDGWLYRGSSVIFNHTFQDLEHFNIGDYKQFDDHGKGMQRLIAFLSASSKILGWNFQQDSDTIFTLERSGEPNITFTSDRDTAVQNEQIQLIGLEHPIIKHILDSFISGNLVLNKALYGKVSNIAGSGLLTYWSVNTNSKEGFNSKSCQYAGGGYGASGGGDSRHAYSGLSRADNNVPTAYDKKPPPSVRAPLEASRDFFRRQSLTLRAAAHAAMEGQGPRWSSSALGTAALLAEAGTGVIGLVRELG